MNYAKLTPALIAALDERGDANDAARLPVFVRFASATQQVDADLLSRLGVRDRSNSRIVTASLPPRLISELSEHPSVVSIELAQPLKFLNDKAVDG
jgi:hypothetical protein